MIRIRRLGPAFIRHVEAYGHLAGAALHDVGARTRTRAMLVALGSALAVAVLILLGATLIAAGWGSPYRYWIATGVILVMAAGAAGCLSSGLAKLPPSTHVQALKVEWQKDKAWLASRGDNEPAPGAAAAHAVKFPAAGRIADPGRAVPGSRNRSNPERV